jgi:hypothetical protein
VQFLARGPGYTLFLTGNAAVLELPGAAAPVPAGARTGRAQRATGAATAASPGAAVRMEVVGADPNARAAGLSELPGKVNYLLGNDPAQWHTSVPTYARVEYPNLYPGISLDYYGSQKQLEYDFIVAPGADPGRVALAFSGAGQVQLDAQGDLVLDTAAGPVLQHAPFLYQEVNGVRQEVAGSFVLHGQRVSFQVGAYDPSQPLVIDPTWSYSTYLGGSGQEDGNGIAVDATGAAYVTGDTTSVNFPTTPNAYQPGYGGAQDAFVTKFSPDGSALVYSTYLGGNAADTGNGIAVDANGNAYVTGDTASANFPTTPGTYQQTLTGIDNVFVTKLNPSGSGLVYSTYIGGEGDDAGAAIAVDTGGNAYVTGDTNSLSYPLTSGAYQTILKGDDSAFVTKLNANGSALLYSTYLGGSVDAQGFGGSDYGASIALDRSGNAYVTGGTQSLDFPTTPGAFQTSLSLNSFGDPTYDGFVSKINPTASGSASLVYSTYLGGNGDDYAMGIAVDSSGSAYVTGATDSTNYPTANAYQGTNAGGDDDAFVTKLNPDGSGLVWSTYLGGRLEDSSCAVAVDALGEAYIAGSTDSPNYPTANPIQRLGAGGFDAFVTKFNAGGSALIYSTYLGGLHDDGGTGIALDAAGNAYVTGNTLSANFPTTPGAFQTHGGGAQDAFVTKVANPGVADHYALSVPPTVTAGVPFQGTVTVQDFYGNTVTTYTGTVHLMTNLGEMGNYTFTPADMGQHTFNVRLTVAGSRTVTATDTTNPAITGNTSFVVLPGPVDHFSVSAPASSPAGQAFDLTVTAQDAYNNTANGYTGTVTFTSSDPGASVPANYPFTAADNGVHTFPGGVTLVTTGDQTVTATDTGNSAVNGSATVTVF